LALFPAVIFDQGRIADAKACAKKGD
jgi:hypothetical protein